MKRLLFVGTGFCAGLFLALMVLVSCGGGNTKKLTYLGEGDPDPFPSNNPVCLAGRAALEQSSFYTSLVDSKCAAACHSELLPLMETGNIIKNYLALRRSSYFSLENIESYLEYLGSHQGFFLVDVEVTGDSGVEGWITAEKQCVTDKAP